MEPWTLPSESLKQDGLAGWPLPVTPEELPQVQGLTVEGPALAKLPLAKGRIRLEGRGPPCVGGEGGGVAGGDEGALSSSTSLAPGDSLQIPGGASEGPRSLAVGSAQGGGLGAPEAGVAWIHVLSVPGTMV